MREIIDGVVYLFGAPLRKHTEAITPLFGQVWFYIRKKNRKYNKSTSYEIDYGSTKAPVKTLKELLYSKINKRISRIF